MRSRILRMLSVLLVIVSCAGANAAVAGPRDASGEGRDGGERGQIQVDLNRATEAELIEVPGIGPALAKRIVEFREAQGPFRRVEDLLKVRGIGEKSFQKLKPYLVVSKRK